MIMLRSRRTVALCVTVLLAVPALLALTTARQAPAPARAVQPRDGQRDFDFEIGRWKTHLRRLTQPMSGSDTWVEYEGTSIVRPVFDGRANLVELDVEGPTGRIQGLSLRLYNPHTRQWSLNYASLRNGLITAPVTGQFENRRGEFYGEDSLDGRQIFVRFVITPITADSCRFEQAFSADGGKTWETNWIAIDRRR